MKRYSLSLALVALIAAASLAPVPETPLCDVPFYDKWAHTLMYLALSLAAWSDYLRGRAKPHWLRGAAVAALMPVAASGLLELAQAYLTTYRSGDWLDFAANAVGVLLASLMVAAYRLLRLRGKK